MNDRLKESFAAIHAEDTLKQTTKSFLARRTNCYTTGRRPVRRLIPVMLCLLVLLAGSGWVYLTPVAVISVDINPSVELGINRFDRVVSVTGFNEEGEALANDLHVRFLDFESALKQLLTSQNIAQYLEQDEVICIAVIGSNATTNSKLLETVRSCAAEHQQADCHTATAEEVAAAHEAGLSYGKYLAFLELQALDPYVTTNEIQDMTMREIRDLIAALSNVTPAQPQISQPVQPEQSEPPAATQPSAPPSGQGHHGQNIGHGSGHHR